MKIPNLADYTPEQLNSYVDSLPNELIGKVIFELVLILHDSPDRVSEARRHMHDDDFDAAPVNILKMEPLELLDYVNTLERAQMASLIFYLVKLVKRLV